MNRRFVLASVSLFLLGVSGCLDSSDTDDNGGTPGSTEESPTDDTPREVCTDIESAVRLGGCPGISIEAEPKRDYEYIDAEDRVRIEYEGGRTGSMPFDEWGTRRATDAASERIAALLEENGLFEAGIYTGRGRVELDDIDDDSIDPDAFDRAVPTGVSVHHTRSYSQRGTLLSEPDVDFETVVDATPRSATVTMLFEEREYTAVLPIQCEKSCGWEE